MRFSRTLATLAVVAFATPALAQVETYTIDSTHTFPSFEVGHLGFSTQRGRFNRTTGKIMLDMTAKTGSVDIVVDTTTIDTGLEALEKRLRADDFFNTEKFPTMTFKGDRMRFEGDKLVAVDGDITLVGITKPVTLQVNSFRCAMHPLAKKPACGADASTSVRRSDFGMVKFPPPIIGEDVKIMIQVEAIKD
jgi:polyisoprenoid-binding protein YceI